MTQRVLADQARYELAAKLQGALTFTDINNAFMSAATLVVPADAYAIYRFDNGSTYPVDVVAKADQGFLDAYEDHGRADDPVLDFVLAERRPVAASGVPSAERWETSAVYQALKTVGLGHSMQAPLIVGGAIVGTVNFARKHIDSDFSADDLVSASFVSQHLGLAMERTLRFEQVDRYVNVLGRAFDRLPDGVIITDLDGRVVFCNRAPCNKGISVGSTLGESKFDATATRVAKLLEKFRAGARVHSCSVNDPVSLRRLVIKGYLFNSGSDVIVFFVHDGGTVEDRRRLPVWNMLSPREREISQLVSEGLTTKQIAERAFIAENTVKQHLKRIFAKVDARNRAELVQLIWTSGDNRYRPRP